ncbi:MAG: TonB-dependent receptor [Chitinophagaceae bacterium]|nr:TonB-dependent receptor [Chitinophagaceae bacterium]
MKKLYLFFILILPFATRAMPMSEVKITLSGRITDAKTGQPLPGASVFLTDDRIGAIANEKGEYIITNIPDGHHVIEVSFTGYATIAEHIELVKDTKKDYALEPVITENQGVIITGVSGATTIRRSPVPVKLVRKSDLVRIPSTNIADALSRLPGVSQLSTGPAISKPIIRGLGYNRVVTVNDGVRQEGQQWGDEHGLEIDEASVSRVEVLKGPASLMYGSDALAGVVNIITNTPVPEKSLRGNIQSGYQSNGSLFSLNGNLAGNENGFNWNVYGSMKSAGDYRNKYDGRVLNSRFNEKNFGGYMGVNKSWGYSHIIFSRFNQRLGLIEGERDDATGKFILYGETPLERIATNQDLKGRTPLIPYQHVLHTKIISDNSFAVNKSRIKLNLAYQDNQRMEFGDAEEPGTKELFFDLGTFNYDLQWRLPETNEWHTTAGLNGMQQNNTNKGEETLIPEYGLFDVGVFVFVQRFFPKGAISGGLRYDNRTVDSKELLEGSDIKFNAFKRSFSNISGSIGTSIEASKNVVLKLNLARGFRAPTLAEMASNGAHEGSNRYEYGDQDLRSETSFQADAGMELSNEHFNISLSAFYNRINHFIFYQKLLSKGGGDSLVNTNGGYIPAFQFTQHNAKLYGLEFTFDIHPHPLDWLHIENNFSYVRGRFDDPIDGSINLPLIPAARWNTELRADIKNKGKHIENLYAKLEFSSTFRQARAFTGFDTETMTAGYTLVNTGVGADIVNKSKTILSLHAGISNLTDVAYQNHLSRLKYTDENMVTGRQGVFNAGRNFFIKMNIPLQFK